MRVGGREREERGEWRDMVNIGVQGLPHPPTPTHTDTHRDTHRDTHTHTGTYQTIGGPIRVRRPSLPLGEMWAIVKRKHKRKAHPLLLA